MNKTATDRSDLEDRKTLFRARMWAFKLTADDHALLAQYTVTASVAQTSEALNLSRRVVIARLARLAQTLSIVDYALLPLAYVQLCSERCQQLPAALRPTAPPPPPPQHPHTNMLVPMSRQAVLLMLAPVQNPLLNPVLWKHVLCHRRDAARLTSPSRLARLAYARFDQLNLIRASVLPPEPMSSAELSTLIDSDAELYIPLAQTLRWLESPLSVDSTDHESLFANDYGAALRRHCARLRSFTFDEAEGAYDRATDTELWLWHTSEIREHNAPGPDDWQSAATAAALAPLAGMLVSVFAQLSNYSIYWKSLVNDMASARRQYLYSVIDESTLLEGWRT